MSITKKYLKSKPVCKVTFRISKNMAPGAKAVFIAGEFNDWSTKKSKMKQLKSGEFTLTIDLETEREYQFRYCIDGDRWENDDNADKYIHNPHAGCDNSVVIV